VASAAAAPDPQGSPRPGGRPPLTAVDPEQYLTTIGPLGQVADEMSLEFIQRILKEADGQDPELVRLVADALEASERHHKRLQALRLEVVLRMRGAGVPMTEIADLARVNDSYLSRLVIRAGGGRRSDRTRPRRRRGKPNA
jgi:hypothetical protein